MKIQIRKGARVKTAGDIVAQELDRIYATGGRLTASTVLEEAARKTSPLHDEFTWDDAKAGHQWRLVEARNLIRAVVVVENEGEEPKSLFVNVQDGGGEGHYQKLEVIAQDVDEFTRAWNEAERALAGAERRIRELEVAAGKRGEKDRLAFLAVARKGLATADNALKGARAG